MEDLYYGITNKFSIRPGYNQMMKGCAILGDEDHCAMQPLIPQAMCGGLRRDI